MLINKIDEATQKNPALLGNDEEPMLLQSFFIKGLYDVANFSLALCEKTLQGHYCTDAGLALDRADEEHDKMKKLFEEKGKIRVENSKSNPKALREVDRPTFIGS